MSNTTPSGASSALENVSVTDLAKHVQSLTDRVDDLEQEVAEKDERIADLRMNFEQKTTRIEELEQRIEELESSATAAQSHREAIARKTQACDERIDELQAREFEKGAHLLADNVEADRISVNGSTLERITKDDGNTYFRLPGEEDALGRGGAVAHSTADLLPIQRLARYDDEMLASVTNRKPDELAGKVWRERDEAGRYSLWSKGSGEIRAYLDASNLAEWIRLKESGVSKKYSQELARRTMDAMHELSNGRLGKIKRQRSKDGLSYQETRLVLKADVELPGEVPNSDTDESPATDGVAGE
ncbi:hypothetical protein [Haladaptatus salinisoli]|uniref:hypothetical protein n=1 Tax=Haladaptatus salinisoli TaxID=2884876 RepID=UPI001D0A81B6|nr:hypothetical protein [Haladaptatus salinisoli]